jgi:membrane glycosyltransferase
MRHGMRVYTAGSVWWQGDAGPYWGHNAIIRIAPFARHCVLPVLPGKPPLGGHLLSHDQVEAVLMRRAGYAVRVLPVEVESFEDNPTTLPDFLRRDLRWCLGNMQYFHLLAMPGLHALGRLQLALAILMYTASPLWLGFIVIGLGQLVFPPSAAGATAPTAGGLAMIGFDLGLALFAVVMLMTFAPKILGIVDVLLRADTRRAYGGARRLIAGALVESVFSLLLAPSVAVAHTIFLAGLAWGRTLHWDPQRRHDRAITPGEALAGLWPQLALGIAAAALIGANAPGLLPWASPLLAGWLLSVPFATLTSHAGLGGALARAGLCASPESLRPTPEIAAVTRPQAIVTGVGS